MSGKTLADISTGGSSVVLYIVAAMFAVISILLISGKGAWLIAGYNTMSAEERKKYNEKRMCRIMGIGFSVTTVLILIMAIFENVLPASFAYIFLAVIIVDVIVMLVLCNTICKNKNI